MIDKIPFAAGEAVPQKVLPVRSRRCSIRCNKTHRDLPHRIPVKEFPGVVGLPHSMRRCLLGKIRSAMTSSLRTATGGNSQENAAPASTTSEGAGELLANLRPPRKNQFPTTWTAISLSKTLRKEPKILPLKITYLILRIL